MNCIICNQILQPYTKISYLDLSVNYCSKCNLYINGNSKDEVIKKVSSLYKKEYWNGNNSEISINSGYTDVNSEGKRRNWNCKIFTHIN